LNLRKRGIFQFKKGTVGHGIITSYLLISARGTEEYLFSARRSEEYPFSARRLEEDMFIHAGHKENPF